LNFKNAAYVERVFSVCGVLTAGKRNLLTETLEKRIMMKIIREYYARLSMILSLKILLNISGSISTVRD